MFEFNFQEEVKKDKKTLDQINRNENEVTKYLAIIFMTIGFVLLFGSMIESIVRYYQFFYRFIPG